jgi:hypothetical protein
MRTAYVGRHRLLPAQARALQELGLEVVRQIENLPTEPKELNQVLQQLKAEGIQAVITIALPPHLLASLSQSFRVFVFEMRSSTVPNVEEAEKFVAQAPEKRTYLPGRPGEPIRVLEFTAINEVRIVIESKRVWGE